MLVRAVWASVCLRARFFQCDCAWCISDMRVRVCVR